MMRIIRDKLFFSGSFRAPGQLNAAIYKYNIRPFSHRNKCKNKPDRASGLLSYLWIGCSALTGIRVFFTRGIPVKVPAFVQQLDLTSVLFAKSACQLIAEPLRQGYLLLLLIPSVWIAYGEKAQSVQVYLDYCASSSYHCSSCAWRARISVSNEMSGYSVSLREAKACSSSFMYSRPP